MYQYLSGVNFYKQIQSVLEDLSIYLTDSWYKLASISLEFH